MVDIRLDVINVVLGTTLSQDQVTRISVQLGFGVEVLDGLLLVLICPRRWDIYM